MDPAELLTRVRFRRHSPAPELRPYLEHYWLIDWDLTEPYASHVVPHPSVNVVFERSGHPGRSDGAGGPATRPSCPASASACSRSG